MSDNLTSCPCCGRIKGMKAPTCKPCEKGYNYGRISMREECAEELEKMELPWDIAAAIRQIRE